MRLASPAGRASVLAWSGAIVTAALLTGCGTTEAGLEREAARSYERTWAVPVLPAILIGPRPSWLAR